VTEWPVPLGALAWPGGADALQAAHVFGRVFAACLVLGTAGFGSALVAVPLLAVVLGHRLARRLPEARLAPLIHGLLVASGLVLALRALRALA
jgi:hypothetical protein